MKDKEFELQQRQIVPLPVDSIKNVDLKLNEIQNQLAPFEKKLISTGGTSSAKEWEEKGFQYLLNRDIENAILAFQNSENSQNGYHQVYEIARFLSENKNSLTDPNSPNWTEVNGRIARDYSWKMPLSVKNRLMENSH